MRTSMSSSDRSNRHTTIIGGQALQQIFSGQDQNQNRNRNTIVETETVFLHVVIHDLNHEFLVI